MNDCKKSRLLFDDAFFGELTGEDKSFLDRHLENCPKCRSELKENTALLSVITKKKSNEPDPGFWDNYTANLHQRMQSEWGGTPTLQKLKLAAEKLTTLSVPTRALQGAAAVVLVIVGIVIGRLFFAPGPGDRNNERLTAGMNARQQETLRRTGSFIDRSRVILLAIENFDPETQSARAINLPYQKKISRDLVKQAVSLKQDLSVSRQRRLKELISELEIILLQIANMDPGSEMETLQLVKGGQYIRGMLYKIRINDLRRSIYKTNEKQRL